MTKALQLRSPAVTLAAGLPGKAPPSRQAGLTLAFAAPATGRPLRDAPSLAPPAVQAVTGAVKGRVGRFSIIQ